MFARRGLETGFKSKAMHYIVLYMKYFIQSYFASLGYYFETKLAI
jgi:hypothetical protein